MYVSHQETVKNRQQKQRLGQIKENFKQKENNKKPVKYQGNPTKLQRINREQLYQNEQQKRQELRNKMSLEQEFQNFAGKINSIQSLKPLFSNFLLRRRLRKLIAQKRLELQIASALLIQRAFRKYHSIKASRQLALVSMIIQLRNHAAIVIQKTAKRILYERRAKYLRLSLTILSIRHSSAIRIQRAFRKFTVQLRYRQVLLYEATLSSIKWFQKSSNETPLSRVAVIGSFNKWRNPIPLVKCPLRHIFVRYFQGLAKGDYEFKFIIDGSYQLSSKYEIIESYDDHGLVNILEVSHEADLHAIDEDKLSIRSFNLSHTTLTTVQENVANGEDAKQRKDMLFPEDSMSECSDDQDLCSSPGRFYE